jgi:structure-specific recognition protein 1
MESENISFSDVVPHDYPNETEEPVTEPADEREGDSPDEASDAEEQEQEVLQEDETPEGNDGAELDNTEDAIDPQVESSPLKKVRRFKSEIKKVASKWMLFSSEVRPKVMADFPEYGFSEVAKAVAERYRSISAEDSERLDLLVSADKERYMAEMADAEDDAPTGARMGDEQLLMHPSIGLSFPLVSGNVLWIHRL